MTFRPWIGFGALGFVCGCVSSPEEIPAGPLHPDELPVVFARRGTPADLANYHRPGLGGTPAVLWVAVQASGEVATWAGLEAPWRDPGCVEGCYAVLAPARALTPDGPPALLAIHPEAPMGQVVGVVRSLQEAGIAAHAVVSPDGTPPSASATAVEVLPLVVGSEPGCGGRFVADVPFGTALMEGCERAALEVWAPEAPARRSAPDRDPFLGMWREIEPRACTIELTHLRMEGIPEEALRPSVVRRLSGYGVQTCANEHGASGGHAFRLQVERGVPTGVEASRGARGAFSACALEALEGWRLTMDATGGLEVGMEVTCTLR